MPKRDLDEALNLYSALMRLVVTHPGGRSDIEGMRRLSDVWARAVEIVNDMETRVLIPAVESRGKLLSSAGCPVGVQRSAGQGSERSHKPSPDVLVCAIGPPFRRPDPVAAQVKGASGR